MAGGSTAGGDTGRRDVALQVVMESVAEHLELESLAVKWLVRLRLSALSNLAEYKD